MSTWLWSNVLICRLARQVPSACSALPLAKSTYQQSGFSTSAAHCARHKPHKKRRGGNVHRGESALRRTGLSVPVGMSYRPLPKPVLDPKRRSKVQVNPDHGLWGFFHREKKALTLPTEDRTHGRLFLSSSCFNVTDAV